MPGTGWTAPRTWVSGEVVTAALMNTHVRDNLLALGDPSAWTAYTPTISGTGWALGDAVLAAQWRQIGKTVDYHVKITWGASSTFGAGGLIISAPVTIMASRSYYGVGTALDTSAAQKVLVQIEAVAAAGGLVPLSTNGTATFVTLQNLTSAIPQPWASTDILELSGSYEAA